MSTMSYQAVFIFSLCFEALTGLTAVLLPVGVTFWHCNRCWDLRPCDEKSKYNCG